MPEILFIAVGINVSEAITSLGYLYENISERQGLALYNRRLVEGTFVKHPSRLSKRKMPLNAKLMGT